MFLWLVGALWALQSLASLLLLGKEFFFVRKRTRSPLLFDQTCEKEDEVFLSCLSKLFSKNSSDENKSSQVLSGASGANTGHFASFFYVILIPFSDADFVYTFTKLAFSAGRFP